MKKAVRSALVLAALLCACGGKGDISYRISDSALYTEAEIREMMSVVEDCFAEHFDGCTLTEISYDEDFSRSTSEAWAEQYQADEAVVLTSGFDTGPSGGDGSLESNAAYENWQWILTRSGQEAWTVQTWGYG